MSGYWKIGAPGVPGGTVMASLGLITGILGFDADGTALGQIFTKTGAVSARAQAYTREEMQAILSHVQSKAADLADGIREGDISVSPAQIREWSACEWCEYSAVCGIDPGSPDCTKRVLPVLTRQELSQNLANHTDTSPRDAKNE